ncbi:2Fe-2S iron-sulfur cluster-binding protein [Oceanobacter mangrovi]|uniref:2Fe-2S iron-sulfur cluster-binding protein n=1 Tax=Oceanobacter mangrovi TaxID=2862510 RepID=UPI001C8D58B5|nr:2Fe-2S iron-sulfur cluster-binding protein [Oceanobacter mangrovi]
MPQLHFLPADISISCEPGQTIMDAARAAGIKMKIACKNGICEICKAQLRHGEVEFSNPIGQHVLEKQNQVLCCVAIPTTDTEIFMSNVKHPDDKPQLSLAFQVQSVTAANDEVMVVELLAPAGKALDFLPGQYLMLHVEVNGEARQLPYSIASAPGSMTGKDVRLLELHIANASDTAAQVIQYLQSQPVVTATLPMGDCFVSASKLQEIGDKPILLICAGTGFAQIKALAEGILALRPDHEVHLYWSNRHSGGFYLNQLPFEWVKQYGNVHFHPILEQATEDWNGRAGWIYQVIQHDFADLSGIHAWACGSPNMVFGTLDQLEPIGLTEANLHSDVFAWATRPTKD